jgi:Lrp/AsnC family transcriptional regulator
MNQLDRYDYAILGALQQDGTLSIADLAGKVGLSSTPCWKRLKRLEEEGYIDKRVAIVNRRKAGLGVTVFVSVRTSQHDEKWLAHFAAAVQALPEVLEFHRMSGDIDYLLKVVTMEQIKFTTELPLHLVSHGLPT